MESPSFHAARRVRIRLEEPGGSANSLARSLEGERARSIRESIKFSRRGPKITRDKQADGARTAGRAETALGRLSPAMSLILIPPFYFAPGFEGSVADNAEVTVGSNGRSPLSR